MSEAPERIVPSCVEALENYQQADMDGIMVLASRQAIHETIDAYWVRVETCEELEARLKTITERNDLVEYANAELGEKLAKAVEHFKKLRRRQDCLETFDTVVNEIVEIALAELTGGKDE